MKVKDIMQKDIISLAPSTPLNNAATIFYEKNFYALPVVENKKLIGIITERDFIVPGENVYLPSYIKFLSELPCSKEIELDIRKEYKKLADIPVFDIMNTNVVTAEPDTELRELIKILSEKKLHSIPVVDKANNIQGMVSIRDIIKLFQSSQRAIEALN
ncbi:hypothetical protein COT20_02330 [bacterium (Candidatus Gribaldobacteria) CG08_land_8_20_14_0_20_39_15]|uniref:CBS domain-containing protein n=1 Tax=bacterium (Candidatus Gribaldobacteria) CG08_land_8_20_14_0_20_39_15 TaxID=2014273 RepID=A0A2M6XU99_9BACT|nr:MAG: hypothetical protein COT20_02330 [bacterium (Candidatus Gribaldobacteria) CG08_land_8_20_14_0_20_39_15]